MKRTLFALVGALLLLTACNTNDPTQVCPVAGRTYVRLNKYDATDTIGKIFFDHNGQTHDVVYDDAYDFYYTMQDTIITLFWDKHCKDTLNPDGIFFYHDTLLIRWVQNSATRDDYNTYFEVK